MADILIKNMTKPKNCVLEEHLSDGSIVKHEVIELPPHGRLVTLDDVIELLGSGISLDTQADRDWAIELAERLPIIVEASNGSDN